MIIRPNLPSHGAGECVHTERTPWPRDRRSSLPFFPARLSFPPSHGVWLELASAWIAPRRGLVAKMHRCLSYNMLAMHLERGHRSQPSTYPASRKYFPSELYNSREFPAFASSPVQLFYYFHARTSSREYFPTTRTADKSTCT